MKLKLTTLFILLSFGLNAQNEYKSKSGLVFKIGDTITLGQPLSHLGWKSIYTDENEDYITNKNLIDKSVIIKSIDITKENTALIITYKRREFFVSIDDALKNKEVILTFRRELANKG